MRRLLPFLMLPLALTAAAPAAAPFTVAESGEGSDNLQQLLSDIRGQDATIVIAPGVYHQCAVQQAGHITYKAAVPGQVIFDGTTCEGKAALVLRGAGSTIDGIVFRNMSVPDGNGAGIRTEQGSLTVRNAMFLDSQEGILGGEPDDQRIIIDHSTFSGLGTCDAAPDCAHAIYLANQGQVTITNSRFERGTGGHYVKLRVPHLTITDNSFDDAQGHKTNYMIDLPEGGTGLIARNTFVQGADKENWTAFITVAAEHQQYSAEGLRVEDNVASLAPSVTRSPAFVADYSHQHLAIGANRLGPGIRAFETR